MGALGLASILALALLFANGSDAPVRAPRTPPSGSEARAPRLAELIPFSLGAAARGTAREFLARFYGERWPALEREMSADHLDLDQPYTFTPWEEVELEFQRSFQLKADELREIAAGRLAWPAELSEAWLRENGLVPSARALDEQDLRAIERAVAPLNEELRRRGEQWAERLDFLIRRCLQEKNYLRAPFTTVGLSHETGFYSRSVGGYGWAATITLTRAQHPEMTDLEREIFALQWRRDECVAAVLRSAPGR